MSFSVPCLSTIKNLEISHLFHPHLFLIQVQFSFLHSSGRIHQSPLFCKNPFIIPRLFVTYFFICWLARIKLVFMPNLDQLESTLHSTKFISRSIIILDEKNTNFSMFCSIPQKLDHVIKILIIISTGVFLYIFLKKCNIVNIKIILFLLAHLNSFFNNNLFFKFINKCQKEIEVCPTFFTCIWFFTFDRLSYSQSF